MSNILVTGGAGFIGSNYVYYHLQKFPDDNIIVLDKLTYAGCKETLLPLMHNKNFTFIKGDIIDEQIVSDIFDKYNINILINFAAESHVDRSILDPDAFIKTNIVGTYNLLNVAKKKWISNGICKGHFHHISTDEVYGTLKLNESPFTEKHQYKPNSPYSASKASSDHLVRAYRTTYGLNATITNCSNNYGPRQFPEKLIPLTITNILEGKSIPIYGDGMQIRDWLYVVDHNRAIDMILQSNQKQGDWNIGGKSELTNLQVVTTICNKIDDIFHKNDSLKIKYPEAFPSLDKKSIESIIHIEDRLGHDRRYAIDPTLIENDFGFTPSVSFLEGIENTIKWYIYNEEWWKALKYKAGNI